MLVAASRFGPIGRSGNTNAAITANRLYVMPVMVPYGYPCTKISTRCTVLGTGSNVRMGVYADGGYRPGTLLVDAGEIATSTAGLKELPIVVDAYINPFWNVLWLACVFNGTAPTMNCNAVSMLGGMGNDSTSNTGASFTGFFRAFTYAPLPAVESESVWTGAITAIVPTIMIG